MAKRTAVFQRALSRLEERFPPQTAYAHCDIPCGIYNEFPALMAAETVQKMVSQLVDLKSPAPADAKGMVDYMNAVSRRVQIKEEHAQICKKEVLILWTDYFKAEHLALFPDLHTTVWNAAKLCSKNKQGVDPLAAQQLLDAVHEIGHMWKKAEEAKLAAAKK